MDELWAHATSAPISNNLEHSKEILARLTKYLNCGAASSPLQESHASFQIGEVMINDEVNSKFIPFLVDIRIGVLGGGQPGYEINSSEAAAVVALSEQSQPPQQQPQASQQQLLPPPSVANLVHKNSMSSSNSMPHFLTNLQQSSPMSFHQTGGFMNKNRYSPPSSPLTATSSGVGSSLGVAGSDESAGYNLQLDYW
jgi:hypothetical protein